MFTDRSGGNQALDVCWRTTRKADQNRYKQLQKGRAFSKNDKGPSDITAGRAVSYRVAKFFDRLVSGKTIFCDCDLNGTLLVTPKNFKCHNITDTYVKHHVYNMILTGDVGLFAVHGCR